MKFLNEDHLKRVLFICIGQSVLLISLCTHASKMQTLPKSWLCATLGKEIPMFKSFHFLVTPACWKQSRVTYLVTIVSVCLIDCLIAWLFVDSYANFLHQEVLYTVNFSWVTGHKFD